MLRSSILLLLVALGVSAVAAGEPKGTTRPISQADSVLAVYYSDWGLASSGQPAIIFVAWPDGHVVWSGDRLKGGAPYRVGRVDPKKIAALLAQFDKDGLFADDELNRAHFGPDAQFNTVLIKSGKKQVEMQSWHEFGYDQAVGDDRPRLEELREAPADYLFFRFVWSETRAKLTDLIPLKSRPSAGKPITKAGVLSWWEPEDAREPSGKPVKE